MPNSTNDKTVCVFCSADDKVAAEYKQTAHALGFTLAQNGFALLSGGGNSGLMNEVNNGHHAANTDLMRHAVVPDIFRDLDVHHQHIPHNNVIWTSDVHERLKKFYELAKAIIVLPGGYGTTHELMDCLVLSQFGVIKKRIILFNLNNFWDGLLQQFATMVRENTLYAKHLEHLHVVTSIEEILQLLQSEHELQLTQGFADDHWKLAPKF